MLRRSLGAFLVFCVCSTAACSSDTEEGCGGREVDLVTAGKLTIAADYGYPPFAYRSPKGDLVGFEVELARAVAREMKLEAVFLNRGSGTLVPGAIAHRHDLAASGLRESPALRSETCVSASYLAADLAVLVGRSAVEEIDAVRDLRGRTVAVLDGSEAEDWALEHLGRSTLASLPTTDDLLTALRQGRADAVVADAAFARFTQEESRDFAVAETVDTEDGYVFVAAPDNGPLVSGVNDAIGRLRASGRLRKIQQKFFGR